eukprot:symbB.v1.2.004251.t4/scaffold241.1/size254724/6
MPMIQWSFECLIQVMCRTDCWNGLIFYPTDDPKHDTNVFFGTSLFDSEFPQSLVLESPRWGLDAQVHTSSDGWLRKKLANIHRKRGEKHPGRICVFADEKHASKLELYFKMTASQLQTGEFWKRKPDAFFVVNRCQVVGTDEWNLEELGFGVLSIATSELQLLISVVMRKMQDANALPKDGEVQELLASTDAKWVECIDGRQLKHPCKL